MPEAVNLRCELRTNPPAIATREPRLSWEMADPRRGAKQTAYQIVAATSLQKLSDGQFDLWDTGKISSDTSAHVIYEGKPLSSGQCCFWRAKLWDKDGVATPFSETAAFEMGLLDRADWKGRWIGSTTVGGPRTSAPSPFLRKSFTLKSPIVRARLYATALGLYKAHLNGQMVGDDIFTPGRTDYTKRVAYQVYDVTSQLKSGENTLGVVLGDGWYCGHVHVDPRQYYGDRPRFLGQFVLDFADGTSQTIFTDDSWKTTSDGPIRSSDLLMGEDYDARREIDGWDTPGFDDSSWQRATLFEDPGIALVPQLTQTVGVVKEIRPPKPPRKDTRRRWVFDLGQNMVGRCRVKVTGPRGTTISIRHAEMLDSDGQLYMLALRSARATDYYTKRTDDEEIYEPRFTFHGFRYVEVRGIHGEATEDTLTGVVLQSRTPETGTFTCSDPMINQLQSNITWSQRGNFIEHPTDCPQRDERLGWTGDAQVFIRTAAFNMDVSSFFEKWMLDVEDSQFPTGGIPSTVPFCVSIPNEGGPAWSDAAIICPWTLYLCYGDTRVLADRYGMMQRFVQFLVDTSNNLIRADASNKWRGYGDWLSHNADTPNDLIGTAFFSHVSGLMAKIATVLGKSNDVAKYAKLAGDVKTAWQKKYLTADEKVVAPTQTANVLALHFDLLPENRRATALAALVADIESRGMHLSTGFVGTPYLCDVLTKNGRPEVAFALLMQKTFPSWLFPVSHGATTMWERWDGWTPEKGFADRGMNSYNHYAYGAVGEWMYASVAGIDLDPTNPGYKHIVVKPHIGGGLTNAVGTLRSMYGEIRSAWTLGDDGAFNLEVTIPPNTTATVELPTADGTRADAYSVDDASGIEVVGRESDRVRITIPAGIYRFKSHIS